MKSRSLHWLGMILIVLIGLIHLYLIPEEYEEAHYLGFLFAVNFLGAIVAAAGIRRSAVWGWGLGFTIAAGSIAGYVVSRTAGMPGMEVEEWLNPAGILVLVLEAVFIVLASFHIPWSTLISFFHGRKHLAVVVALEILVLFGFLINLWNTRTIPITAEQLEEKYGVQIRLIGLTNLDGNLDFRMYIKDSEKAKLLLGGEHYMAPVLVVEGSDQVLVSPRHTHRIPRMGEGNIYSLFFPNPKGVVRHGTPVSVEFGNLRLEPIPAQ